MRPEAEALLAGDTARLAQLTAGQADTLLQMLAGREILGTKPGEGLGAPRAAVDVLIGKATRLDLPLDRAVRSDRVEYVRLLLDAGADPGTRTDGITPLENAIGVGNTQMVDLLAEHGIVPQALWTYAACGRLDLVQACFDADGRLRPDAALLAPQPRQLLPCPAPDPGDRRSGADHGRGVRLRLPARPDRGRALVPRPRPEPRRRPLPRADRTAPGDHAPAGRGGPLAHGAWRRPVHPRRAFPFDAAGLLAILSAVDGRDPVIRQLHELLKPRSAELPPQVPSRRSPSADRTTGAVRPVPQPAIRHEIHEAFMTSPPPSSAGDTSSADHLPGLISAQIRPPRRVNTQVNELHAVRACEGVTSREPGQRAA